MELLSAQCIPVACFSLLRTAVCKDEVEEMHKNRDLLKC